MRPIIFNIRKQEGKMTQQSREEMARVYKGLVDGDFEFRITKITRTYLTRYRYYFAYLLPEIITGCNFSEIDKESGEIYPMTAETLHDILKLHFNSNLATDPFKGGFIRIPASTTKLSDSEFIDRYENEISAHFQTEFHIELLSRSEWIDRKKMEHKKKESSSIGSQK